MNTQINIALPKEWKKELEILARVFSVEEEETMTYLDLIRRAIKEKYRLKDAEKWASISQHHIVNICVNTTLYSVQSFDILS